MASPSRVELKGLGGKEFGTRSRSVPRVVAVYNMVARHMKEDQLPLWLDVGLQVQYFPEITTFYLEGGKVQ